jgi:short-subunit dehydrogenase
MILADKIILVTGSTGGIGQQLCQQLADQGAKLVLSCYDEAALQKLQATLGAQHIVVSADISNQQGREKIVAACSKAGGIDAVINLAGILEFTLFETQSSIHIEKIITINLTALMLLSQGLIPQLRAKPEAAMVNVGSIFGSIGHPGFAAYCASKAGVKCFTEALSRELADTQIHFSYIAPRATQTALNNDQVNALNKALGNSSDSPEYVARQIVDVLKRNRSLRFLGWPEKLFVKVNALFPSLVHRALVKNLKTIKQFATQ